MKKIIPIVACALAFHLQAAAQTNSSVKAAIYIKPDLHNPGCVLSSKEMCLVPDEQNLTFTFNIHQLETPEDVNTYFGKIGGNAILMLRKNDMLEQALSKEFTDQPLRIDAMININGQNIPAVFEAVKKTDTQKNVYSELLFAIPYESMGVKKDGEVKLVINLTPQQG